MENNSLSVASYHLSRYSSVLLEHCPNLTIYLSFSHRILNFYFYHLWKYTAHPRYNIEEFKLYYDQVDGFQWQVSLTAEYRLS